MNITPNASAVKANPLVDQPAEAAQESTHPIDLFATFNEKYGTETQNDNTSDADISDQNQRSDNSISQDNIADESIFFALADQNLNTSIDEQAAPTIVHQPRSPKAVSDIDITIPEGVGLPSNLTDDIESSLGTTKPQEVDVAIEASDIKFEAAAHTTPPQEAIVGQQAPDIKLESTTPTIISEETFVKNKAADEKLVREEPIIPNRNVVTELNNQVTLPIANDLTASEADLVQTPPKPQDTVAPIETQPKEGRAFAPNLDTKDALSKISLASTGDIKPDLVNVTSTIVGEPLASLVTTTTPTAETLLRTPQATQTGLQLSTSHPAIQTVAQNLIKVQETKSGVSVQLDPPEMGRVFIDFQFEADKSVTATIRSDIADTSAALKDKAEFFQQILKENGFNDVTLSFEQNDSSSKNAFNQDDKTPSYFTTDAETDVGLEAQANPPQPINNLYKSSPETAIDIKL